MPQRLSVLEQFQKKLQALSGPEVVKLAAEVGFSRQGIYVLRAGKTAPNLDRAERIFAALGYRLTLVPVAEGEDDDQPGGVP